MLRLVLLENLRRLAERMVWGWEERRRAERWAAEVLAAPAGPMRGRRRRSRGPAAATPRSALPGFDGLSDPFVVRLMQLLRDQEGAAGRIRAPRGRAGRAGLRPQRGPPPRAPLPGRQPGHRRQLRAQPPPALGHRLERLLRAVAATSRRSSARIPRGVYPHQDFATSDRYRRMVETIARGSGADEIEVARRALELARQGSAPSRRASGRRRASRAATSASTWSIAARRSLKAAFGYRPGLARAALRLGAGPSAARSTSARSRRCSPRSWPWPSVRAWARWPARGGCSWRSWSCCCRSPSWPWGWSTTCSPCSCRPASCPSSTSRTASPPSSDVHRHPRRCSRGLERAPCWPSGSRPTTCPTPTPASGSPC